MWKKNPIDTEDITSNVNFAASFYYADVPFITHMLVAADCATETNYTLLFSKHCKNTNGFWPCLSFP